MTPIELPCALPGVEVDDVREHNEVIEIVAHSIGTEAFCPVCQRRSTHVHSYYRRSPADLLIADRRVRLVLTVRRFRCLNQHCARVTFAERLPELVAPHEQHTERLGTALEAVALAVGGQAGQALTQKLKMPASRDTLLRLVRRTSDVSLGNPEVLGVDDWAQRRGRVYGTILVDLERRRAVDLLPDRTAETLAHWLQAHSSVKAGARCILDFNTHDDTREGQVVLFRILPGKGQAFCCQLYCSLRTPVLRPTWHFVTPADIRWLLALTARQRRGCLPVSQSCARRRHLQAQPRGAGQGFARRQTIDACATWRRAATRRHCRRQLAFDSSDDARRIGWDSLQRRAAGQAIYLCAVG